MGGETPFRAELKEGQDTPELVRESKRRMALAQIVLGAPMLFLIVFGLVLGYRFGGRSVGDGPFWAVLIPVLVAFCVYYARAILVLRRNRPGMGSRGLF